MDSKYVNMQIDEIERHLRIEDPALVRRIKRRRRREATHDIAVFAFLASSAVFLVAGLATLAPVVYCAGFAAFLAAFLADRQLAPPADPGESPRRSRPRQR